MFKHDLATQLYLKYLCHSTSALDALQVKVDKMQTLTFRLQYSNRM